MNVYADIVFNNGGSVLAMGDKLVCNQQALSSGCSVSSSCRENVYERDIQSTGDGGFHVVQGSEGCTTVLATMELMVPDGVALNGARVMDP